MFNAQAICRPSAFVCSTNLENQFVSELCPVMLGATWKSFWFRDVAAKHSLGMTSLIDAVKAVIGPCPNPDMYGIAACRVIAVVAGTVIIRNQDTMPDFIHDTWGWPGPVEAIVGNRDMPIPIAIKRLEPWPATIRARVKVFMTALLNIVPESVEKRGHDLHATRTPLLFGINVPAHKANAMLAVRVPLVVAEFIQGFRGFARNTDLHQRGSFIQRRTIQCGNMCEWLGSGWAPPVSNPLPLTKYSIA